MSRYTALVILALVVPGCCWMAKRNCFPKCPLKPAPRIVVIEKACELPPLKLPSFQQMANCPAEQACFDRANAARLYIRLARLKDFATEARARCAPLPTSQPSPKPPTSQPVQ